MFLDMKHSIADFKPDIINAWYPKQSQGIDI